LNQRALEFAHGVFVRNATISFTHSRPSLEYFCPNPMFDKGAVHCCAQVPTFGLRKNVETLEESSHHRDEAAALVIGVVGVGY